MHYFPVFRVLFDNGDWWCSFILIYGLSKAGLFLVSDRKKKCIHVLRYISKSDTKNRPDINIP